MSENTEKQGIFGGFPSRLAASRKDSAASGKTDQFSAPLVHLLMGLTISLVVFFSFTRISVLRQAELNTLDQRYQLRPRIDTSPRLGTIDIDTGIIDRAGSWPISRRFYAHFMRVLNRYDAALMSMDLFFPDPSPLAVTSGQLEHARSMIRERRPLAEVDGILADIAHNADEEMVRAMEETRLVVLAQTFVQANPEDFPSTVAVEKKAREIAREKRPAHAESLQYAQEFSVPYSLGTFDNQGVILSFEVEPPDPRFLAKAVGLGFAQVVLDIDGTVRKYPLFIHYRGRMYPSLAMMGISLVAKVPLAEIKIVPGEYVLLPRAKIPVPGGGYREEEIRIPVDKQLRMIVNWAGDYLGTFTHFPATLLLQFEGVDAMRACVRRHEGNPAALIAEGTERMVEDVTNKMLMPREQAEAVANKLLVAQLAETLSLKKIMTRDEFVASRETEADKRLFGEVWDQVVCGNKILEQLKEDPGRSFETLKEELQLPDRMEGILRHTAKMLRFLLERKKPIQQWRPLYFFPPEDISVDTGEDRGMLSPVDLVDKILYVGLTATGTHDFNPMPFSPRYPMVGLHVNAFNTIFTRAFIRDIPPAASLLLLLLLAGVVVYAAPRLHPVAGAGFMLVLCAGYLLATKQVFDRQGLCIPAIPPVVTIMGTYLSIITHRFFNEQREKQKVRNAFSTYITPAVVDQILKNPGMLQLGGQRRDMTVYFSDLADFTVISETSSPEDLVQLLNEYFDGMTGIIFKYGGTLDKYEGDAVMAFWGAPIEVADHAYRCCCAALDALQHLENVLQPKWRAEGKPPLAMRIGINTGSMIVGNMGSNIRMDYTVMGDAVNLGARLEAANKEYGSKILISQYTYESVADRIVTRELDSLLVKGKKKPVKVYEIMARKGELPGQTQRMLEAFSRGLNHYRNRRWEEGAEAFLAALEIEPGDGPSQTYRKRCLQYAETPPPADWDSVWTRVVK